MSENGATSRITCAASCSAAWQLLGKTDVKVILSEVFHIVFEVSHLASVWQWMDQARPCCCQDRHWSVWNGCRLETGDSTQSVSVQWSVGRIGNVISYCANRGSSVSVRNQIITFDLVETGVIIISINFTTTWFIESALLIKLGMELHRGVNCVS
jgi:hypothetical protein